MRVKIRVRLVNNDFDDNKIPLLSIFICLFFGIMLMIGGVISQIFLTKIENIDYNEVINYPKYQNMSLDQIKEFFDNQIAILRIVRVVLFTFGSITVLSTIISLICFRIKQNQFINNLI